MIHPRRLSLIALALLIGLSITTRSPGQSARHSVRELPLRQLKIDKHIPTARQLLGYDWGDRITSHAKMHKYLEKLAAAAPRRAKLVQYGSSYEERGLYYLVITSPENFERLDDIRAENLKLADPRRLDQPAARELADRAPAIVWLAASVHGNELSSTEAALVTAYHLLADERPATRNLLSHLVVVIDPLQNPDGRERFINNYREASGRFHSANPWSTEHAEPWPGGRFNHYLFDMNRDWFLHSQQETVAKVRAFLEWRPQLFVDAHEMGRNSSYFFVPPTDPVNPFILPSQVTWLEALGRNQAAWFDRYGFDYTTREIFDSFYPGYGSEWPTCQGGLGILWEQAGTRGLAVDRDDQTQLQYWETIQHHYVSAVATLEIAAARRSDLLYDFCEARRRGLQLGAEGTVRHFYLPVGRRPHRSARLAQLLIDNGVEVRELSAAASIVGTDILTGESVKRTLPAGTLEVPVNQPAGQLVRVLLDRSVDMDEAFVRRQLDRNAQHLPDEIYDVTAWSLPLAFDVPCLAASAPAVAVETRPWKQTTPSGSGRLARAKVAYAVRPDDGALVALSQWLQQGLRVHVTDKSFQIGNQTFPRGTLLIKVRENGEDLLSKLQQATRQYALRIVPLDSGFVTAGAHFGGPHVKWVRPPQVLLAVGTPAATSVGHTWYLFDQVLHYPTTRVKFEHLARVDLHKFNVLVMPHGDYTTSKLDKGFGSRIEQWIRGGGTLVLVKGALNWAADKEIHLLELDRVAKAPEKKPSTDDAEDGAEDGPLSPSGPVARESSSAKPRWPDAVPGAFLRATLFDQHWLTLGCPKTMNVFFSGNQIYRPLPSSEGRNVVQFAGEDELLSSGFCWPETLRLIAGKPFLVYKSIGSGHVIGFTDDPTYRAMYPSLQRLLINACLFGPGQ